MLKPFLLFLVLSGLGATVVDAGGDQPTPDISTWRWNVSVILDAQRASDPAAGIASAATFGQRYERYSILGLPEAPAEGGPR